MREPFPPHVEAGRVQRNGAASPPGESYGAFYLKAPTGAYFFVMVGDAKEWPFDGPGWEHVSAHVRPSYTGEPRRCPTWEEMCWLKDQFFRPEEWVIQFHPATAENISVHDYTLHLWRVVGVEFPTPPRVCV